MSEPLARSHWPSPRSPWRERLLDTLPVAGRHVVADDVARDVGPRVGGRDPPRVAADDDAELGLEVEGVAARRPDDRAPRRRPRRWRTSRTGAAGRAARSPARRRGHGSSARCRRSCPGTGPPGPAVAGRAVADEPRAAGRARPPSPGLATRAGRRRSGRSRGRGSSRPRRRSTRRPPRAGCRSAARPRRGPPTVRSRTECGRRTGAWRAPVRTGWARAPGWSPGWSMGRCRRTSSARRSTRHPAGRSTRHPGTCSARSSRPAREWDGRTVARGS